MTVTAVTLRAIPGHNPPLASRTPQECQYRSGMSAAEYAARYGGMPEAKFGSNENAAGVSPSAVEAVRPTSEGIHRYPPMQDDGFREILRPDDFTYDVDAIRAAVDASTRLVFLCSPNNPTGTTCPPVNRPEFSGGDNPSGTLITPAGVVPVLDEVYHHRSDSPRSSFEILDDDVILIHSFQQGLWIGGGETRFRHCQGEHRARSCGVPIAVSHRCPDAGCRDSRMTGRRLCGTDCCRGSFGPLHVGRPAGVDGDGSVVEPGQLHPVSPKRCDGGDALYEALLSRGIIVRPLAGFYLPDCLRVSVGTSEENNRLLAALEGALEEIIRRNAPGGQ